MKIKKQSCPFVTFARSYHYHYHYFSVSTKRRFAGQTNRLLPSRHRFRLASPIPHLPRNRRRFPHRRLRRGNRRLRPFEGGRSPESVASRTRHPRWPQPIGKDVSTDMSFAMRMRRTEFIIMMIINIMIIIIITRVFQTHMRSSQKRSSQRPTPESSREQRPIPMSRIQNRSASISPTRPKDGHARHGDARQHPPRHDRGSFPRAIGESPGGGVAED